MPGRGMGERLAVDPNRSSVVYFGAPGGHGLYRSTDSGATWARVPGLTNPGNYADDPADPNGYNSEKQGVVWVTFDPRTGSAGQATQTIYAGVADKENPVYRSTDGGTHVGAGPRRADRVHRAQGRPRRRHRQPVRRHQRPGRPVRRRARRRLAARDGRPAAPGRG